MLLQFGVKVIPCIGICIKPYKRLANQFIAGVLAFRDYFDRWADIKDNPFDVCLVISIVHTFENSAVFFFAKPHFFLHQLALRNILDTGKDVRLIAQMDNLGRNLAINGFARLCCKQVFLRGYFLAFSKRRQYPLAVFQVCPQL